MLYKVISGGQIGADQAALRAAQDFGIETGGWVPLGWNTVDGPAPWLANYGCKEHTNRDYPSRTYANVEDSDCTLAFAFNFNTPGERCTFKACQKFNKGIMQVLIPSPDIKDVPFKNVVECAQWLHFMECKTLNVAGNAKRSIEPIVIEYLTGVFNILNRSVQDDS